MRTTTAAVAQSVTIEAEVMDVVTPLREFVPVISALPAYVSSRVISLIRAALTAVSSEPSKTLEYHEFSNSPDQNILQSLALAVLLKKVATICSRAVTLTMSSSKTFTKAVTEAGVRTVDITGTSASTNTTAVASSPMEWDQPGQMFHHLLLFSSSRSRLRSDRRNKVRENGVTVPYEGVRSEVGTHSWLGTENRLRF